jgi:hypothetical protein
MTVPMFKRPDRNTGTFAGKARVLSVLTLFAPLAACSSLGGKAEANAEPLSCPRVAIARDASEVTQFRPGAGKDLTDIRSRAALLDFTGGCEYDRNGVTVNLNLILAAERGPAMTEPQSDYRYFVAIADPEGQVLAKREFDTSVEFAATNGRGGSVEELSQQIPLPEGKSAGDYQVLVGFQLAPEQLEYNRKERSF